MLKKADVQLLHDIFKGLDEYNDLIVSRKKLVDKLKSDPRI